MHGIKIIAGVVILCLLATGCATTSGGPSDQTRTKVEGTAVGAVVGGLLGYAIGGKRGAVIGAAAGTGLGFLAANEVAKRKKAYATTEEFLDAEIASTQEFNHTALAYNEKISREVASLEEESAVLRAKFDRGQVDRQKLLAKRQELQKRLEDTQKLEKNLSQELEIQTTILEQGRKERPQDDPRIAKLEKEVAALQKNLEKLREGSTQLARIDQRLSV